MLRTRRKSLTACAPLVPDPPGSVGLFADQPLDEVVQTIKTCGLDLAQLCGKESQDYCRQVMEQAGAEIIKVLHVSPSETASSDANNRQTVEARLAPYLESGCHVTLDRLVEGLQGGTGQSFNWDVAAQLSGKGLPIPPGRGSNPGQRGPGRKAGQPLGRRRFHRRRNQRPKRRRKNPRLHQ